MRWCTIKIFAKLGELGKNTLPLTQGSGKGTFCALCPSDLSECACGTQRLFDVTCSEHHHVN